MAESEWLVVSSTEMRPIHGRAWVTGGFVHGNGAFSWPRVGGGWFRPRKWGVFMAERGWLVVSSTEMGRFHGRE